MENGNCCVCQKPKATLQCGSCNEPVCKKCAQFLEEGSFSFMPVVPAELKPTTFCGPCFDAKVAPALQEYEANMQKAKGIVVYYVDDSKQTRHFKRLEKAYKILDCPDKEEALLRMAFLAVTSGFNALLDVELKYEKIRNGSYQTTKWSGTGVPATLTSRRFLD